MKMVEMLEGAAENPVVDAENLEDGTALIIDAMAVLQTMKGKMENICRICRFHICIFDETCPSMESCQAQLKAVIRMQKR